MRRWPQPESVVIAESVETFHTGLRTVLPRALLLGAGRILGALDPDDRANRRQMGGCDVVELDDCVVVPGFVDAHNHQPSAARDVGEIRTSHVTSLVALRDTLAEAAHTLPSGTWLTTEHSLSVSQLGLGRLPRAAEFDDVTPTHPVAVRFGAHTMVLNSLGLQESGLALLEVDPPRGRLDRDLAGRPLGPIHEYGATAMVLEQLRAKTPRDLVDAMRTVQREYAGQGITSVRVPGLRPGDLSVYESLLREDGRLANRVFGGPRLDPTQPIEKLLRTIETWPVSSGFANDWLGVDAVKIFVDSGLESVADGATDHFVTTEELNVLVEAAVVRGWSVTCHAIAADAVEKVLTVYARVANRLSVRARLAVEHGFLATAGQLGRAAALGVWLSTQPAIGSVESDLLRGHLSNAELASFAPVATALRLGASCALGSDWNATPGTMRRPLGPLRTVQSATNATERDRRVGADEAVDTETAFYLHTRAGAELLDMPDLGGIWPGAYADLVALPRGVTQDPASAGLDSAGVLATIIGGALL